MQGELYKKFKFNVISFVLLFGNSGILSEPEDWTLYLISGGETFLT